MLHGLDLAGLDETAQLGHGLPFLLLLLAAATATATSSAVTSSPSATAAFAEAASTGSSVSHVVSVVTDGRMRVSFVERVSEVEEGECGPFND